MPDNRVNYGTHNQKSWWTIERYDTGSSAWVSDSAIPAPGVDEIEQVQTTTSQMVQMADGSLGRMTPDVHFNYENFRMIFHKRQYSANLYSQFKGYNTNNTGVRITTHTGEKFEGYVDRVNRLWNINPGLNGRQDYSIEVVVQPFDVSGDGVY